MAKEYHPDKNPNAGDKVPVNRQQMCMLSRKTKIWNVNLHSKLDSIQILDEKLSFQISEMPFDLNETALYYVLVVLFLNHCSVLSNFHTLLCSRTYWMAYWFFL